MSIYVYIYMYVIKYTYHRVRMLHAIALLGGSAAARPPPNSRYNLSKVSLEYTAYNNRLFWWVFS